MSSPPDPPPSNYCYSTHSSSSNRWPPIDPDSNNSSTIRRRKNCLSLRRRDGLIKHARNRTSQNGEDGVIERLFELLPPSSSNADDDDDGNVRYCVDVGAWDGVHLSNTHSLLAGHANESSTNQKWRGVLIEADPRRFQDLKNLHDPLGNISICARVSCRPDSPRSLPSLLEKEAPALPIDFDFLSIDVDGMDYWVLANILGVFAVQQQQQHHDDDDNNNRHRYYRPKVICIEFNPTMPMDLIYVQPRNDSIRHGSSLSAMCELANAAGYELVETTLFNAFFVKCDLYQRYLKELVPDTSIEALHEMSMGTTMYQLYDGTIKLWGCKRMLWHRLPMEEEKMQMLPMEERQFPFAPSAGDDAVVSSVSPVTNGGVDGNQLLGDAERIESRSQETKLKNDQIRELAIDMSPYCQNSNNSNSTNTNHHERKRECITKLIKMLQTDGFALVRGTGISPSTCDNALKAAKSFLHDANESVRRSCLTQDRARRGYSPMCTENFASLVGKHGPNDLVKKFRVGPDPLRRVSSHHDDGGLSLSAEELAEKPSLSSLHQPNAWPRDNSWSAETSLFFRTSIEEYYESTCRAADSILRAICDGIVVDNNDLADSIRAVADCDKEKPTNHTSILTLLGYQPGSRHKKGSKGYLRPLVAAHTDVGMITILLFDSGRCASLQRASSSVNGIDAANNEWVDIHLPKDAWVNNDIDPVFVVNVGDCLPEVSGGSLRSTLHRVIPHPCDGAVDDAVRTCLALFVGLEPSSRLVLPLSGETMTYEEWRRKRIARALAVLKSATDS